MIPAAWRAGEVAVIGLGRSGRSASRLLRREGVRVYAADGETNAIVQAAVAELRTLGADAEGGGYDLGRIARAAVVVVSPGVPPSAAPLAAARGAGVPVVSEVELALHCLPLSRIIAITGTNGKTTTTALVGHVLVSLGVNAVTAGNIGTPLADIALMPNPPAWIALELSSFQLHDTPSIAPAVGVMTNLSPDHLDRYPNAKAYYADKALLFANASAASHWVVNDDDAAVRDLVRAMPGTVRRFSIARTDADGWFDHGEQALVVLGEPLLRRRDLALFGDHNVANALAASLSVLETDPALAVPRARERVAQGLRTFSALPHRLETVAEIDGVLWINDSKATNVSSTMVAMQGMTRPTVLLLGGRHKGEAYTALAEPLRTIGRAVIAFGEAAPLIERDLDGVVPVVRLSRSFDDVIERARRLARPGDVVLLSPACSSYDMFSNYEHRGAEFRRLAVMRDEARRA
jgi:UDP-N-acetylmuramoylalanine--D-glutamate ligase